MMVPNLAKSLSWQEVRKLFKVTAPNYCTIITLQSQSIFWKMHWWNPEGDFPLVIFNIYMFLCLRTHAFLNTAVFSKCKHSAHIFCINLLSHSLLQLTALTNESDRVLYFLMNGHQLSCYYFSLSDRRSWVQFPRGRLFLHLWLPKQTCAF